MLVLLVLSLFIAPALFLLGRALAKGRRMWPPGPPPLPIIGHLHLLGSLPHQSLCTLSQLYGPLMGLHLGRIPTIVASSPDMAKAILQTHDLTFASRPPSAAAVHMYFGSASLGNLPHGPLSKRLRQLLASELFSSKCLEAFRYVREEEVRELIWSVLKVATERPHKPVELRASLLATSNNINWRMATGKRIRETSTTMRGKKDVLSLVEEVMHLMGVFIVGDFIPWLAWLDPQGYMKRMKGASFRANVMMQAMIDERKEAHKAMQNLKGQAHLSGPNNLLDAMLVAAAENEQENNAAAITDDNIKGLLLVTGFRTTNQLCRLMYLCVDI